MAAHTSGVIVIAQVERIAERGSRNAIVNLGIGMPEGVAAVAAEQQVIDLVTLTAEPGVIGGIPASGLNFGASINTQAVIDQPSQFDFCDGGGLDRAVLGLDQADAHGPLNVSKFRPRLAGAGGFINISQAAKVVVYVGTCTVGDLQLRAGSGQRAAGGGRLQIVSESTARKVVREVEHRTFSGSVAAARGQRVLCVTERCVFRLRGQGLELIEIAPGFEPSVGPKFVSHPDGGSVGGHAWGRHPCARLLAARRACATRGRIRGARDFQPAVSESR